MSTPGRLLAIALACPLATAQGKPEPKPAPVSTVYQNKDLGLRFSGVYGWNYEAASGSGAWTQLAKYSETAFQANVLLLVRNNTFTSLEAMRAAVREEFAESKEEDPAPGRSAFREVALKDVEMREGMKLPGVDVEAVSREVGSDGKKRESKLLVRTYHGKHRLYRVHCSAARGRYKKVQELFERAAASLVVDAVEERGGLGIEFHSARGGYSCIVP
ncbi:MAG: hypothetical protein ACREID_03520, partial [Planctomycetota bacterium]